MKPLQSVYFSSLFGFELNEEQESCVGFKTCFDYENVGKCIFCNNYDKLNWACKKCDKEGVGSKVWGNNDPDYYLVVK